MSKSFEIMTLMIMLISLLKGINVEQCVKYIRIPKGYLSNTKLLLVPILYQQNRKIEIIISYNHLLVYWFGFFFFPKSKVVMDILFFA